MRRPAALAVLTAGLASVAPAGAALDPCVKAVSKAVSTYIPAKYKAIESCEDKRSSGKLAPSVNCRPAAGAVTDAKTDAKLTKAAAKATTLITTACTSVPAIGTACDSSPTVAALAACITSPAQDTDTEQLNADSLINTVYDTAAPVDPGLRKCEATIGKEAGKYLKTRIKVAMKCESKFTTASDPLAACPDAKAKIAFDKARGKLDAGVRTFCTEPQLASNVTPQLTFGLPCESYKLVTFKRVGVTNTNSIPVLDRAIACMADSTAGVGDRMVEIAFPGHEDGMAATAFPDGVAAGDATDTAVVFWTRTADSSTGALLEVSTSVTLTSPVFSGTVPQMPLADGALKQDVTGLSTGTTYFYRWTQNSVHSRVGKVKTAPSPATAAPVHLGWSGDANAFFRPYTVVDPLRFANVDGWFFIGDTIYGDDPRSSGLVSSALEDYQFKYVENRADRGLRDIMAAAGTYVQWDDHESRNDVSGTVPAVATKVANGNLAFRQYNPIREDGGDPTRLYRSFKWGTAAEFFLIDLRQYRSAKYTCCSAGTSGFVLTDDDSTCTGGGAGELGLPDVTCNTALAGNDILTAQPRTVLGAAQKAWLKNALQNSTATFKFIMNGPPITQLVFVPYDRWEGYPAERTEILDFIRDPNGDLDTSDHLKNVIFLSTDLHGIVVSHDRVDSTHNIPEVVAGAVGMDPIFRELPPLIASFLPSLPGLLTQITEFDIDRFNVVTIDVDPAHSPTPQTNLHFFDRSGAEIHTVTFDAEP